MSTESELPDDDYPPQWRPRERRLRDEALHEMELALAALPAAERLAMLKRIEANS